jgi:hypothetical protein
MLMEEQAVNTEGDNELVRQLRSGMRTESSTFHLYRLYKSNVSLLSYLQNHLILLPLQLLLPRLSKPMQPFLFPTKQCANGHGPATWIASARKRISKCDIDTATTSTGSAGAEIPITSQHTVVSGCCFGHGGVLAPSQCQVFDQRGLSDVAICTV